MQRLQFFLFCHFLVVVFKILSQRLYAYNVYLGTVVVFLVHINCYYC